MRTVYTKHAINKLIVFKRHQVKITKNAIRSTIENPEHEDKSQPSKVIASKSADEKHILRVVYREENDKIVIITFYPAEKGRYY